MYYIIDDVKELAELFRLNAKAEQAMADRSPSQKQKHTSAACVATWLQAAQIVDQVRYKREVERSHAIR